MRFREQLTAHFKAFSKEGLKIKEMAKRIAAEDKTISLKASSLVEYLRTLKRELSEIVEVDNTDSWVVEDGSYIFTVTGDRKVYSVAFIDDLFTHYSRKGYNFTRIKTQLKFDLTPKAWGQIARQFNLSKDCDILSPYTLENTDREELEGVIENKIQTILTSGEMTTQKYADAVTRKHRSIIEADNLKNVWEQEIINELLEGLPKAKVIEVKKSKDSNNLPIIVAMGDFHAGGKAKGMKLIKEDWGTNVLIEKLHNAAEVINSYNSEDVTLSLLGDLVESISALNHMDSWKGIEEDGFGSSIIIKTYEMLVEHLFNRVNNLGKITLVGGNHDRLQASNNNADTGASDLIAYMLKMQYKHVGIPVEWDSVLLTVQGKGFSVITVHGDKNIGKREIAYMKLKFTENPKEFTFIASAHLHNFMCRPNDDQEIGRRVTIPSIMTGNKYSDVEVGKAAKSGLVIFKLNVLNEPSMIVENI